MNDDLRERLHRAEYAVSLERYGKARELLADILRDDPTSPEALATRARVEMLDEQFDAAKHFARQTIEQDPADPDAHFLLACALGGGGEHADALRAVITAKQLDPYRAAFHGLEAQTLLFLDRAAEAETTARADL